MPNPMPTPDLGPLSLYRHIFSLVAEGRCSDSHKCSSLLGRSVTHPDLGVWLSR